MGERSQSNQDSQDGLELLSKTKPTIKPPSMYKVVFHNDDFTPQEFVVDVLQKHFNLDLGKATEIMMKIHTLGFGYVGPFSFDIAQTKCQRVVFEAQKAQHPLKCTVKRNFDV